MKHTLILVLLSTIIMISSPALCKTADEIDYLLSFISTSECTFIRNGKEYDSGEAAEHLEMKYNHVKKRINSADVFIEKIASKSSLSRKAYTVRCGGKEILSQQWLIQALRQHRTTLVK